MWRNKVCRKYHSCLVSFVLFPVSLLSLQSIVVFHVDQLLIVPRNVLLVSLPPCVYIVLAFLLSFLSIMFGVSCMYLLSMLAFFECYVWIIIKLLHLDMLLCLLSLNPALQLHYILIPPIKILHPLCNLKRHNLTILYPSYYFICTGNSICLLKRVFVACDVGQRFECLIIALYHGKPFSISPKQWHKVGRVNGIRLINGEIYELISQNKCVCTRDTCNACEC